MRLILDFINPNHEFNNKLIKNKDNEIILQSKYGFRKTKEEFTVDWGDGNVEKYNHLPVSHIYNDNINSIIHRVIIEYEGETALSYLTFNNDEKLKRVEGILPPLKTIKELFKNCVNLSLLSSNLFLLNTDQTDIESIFENTYSLEYTKSLGNLHHIKIADKAFKCSGLKHIPILDLSNVKAMNETFMGLYNLVSIPMMYFDNALELVTGKRMFKDCFNLEFIGYNPFYKCKSLKNVEDCFENTKVILKDNFKSYFENSNIKI